MHQDAVDVHGGCGDEGDDEAGGGSEQRGDHQHAKPADIQAVLGAGYPVTKLFPQPRRFRVFVMWLSWFYVLLSKQQSCLLWYKLGSVLGCP